MKTKTSCCDTKSLEMAQDLIEGWDARFFKTLGEPVRMEILRYLLLNGRSDIGSISENLPQDRSVISRHLQLMLDSGLLHCEKETRFRYYSINGGNFINKLEATAFQLRKCMSVCCPECLEPDVISKEQLNKQDSE
jgi:DNA-binding transcriptional ArsR family regulator